MYMLFWDSTFQIIGLMVASGLLSFELDFPNIELVVVCTAQKCVFTSFLSSQKSNKYLRVDFGLFVNAECLSVLRNHL